MFSHSPGSEMVSITVISFTVDSVVTIGIMRTLYPDLTQITVSTLSSGLRVSNDNINTR